MFNNPSKILEKVTKMTDTFIRVFVDFSSEKGNLMRILEYFYSSLFKKLLQSVPLINPYLDLEISRYFLRKNWSVKKIYGNSSKEKINLFEVLDSLKERPYHYLQGIDLELINQSVFETKEMMREENIDPISEETVELYVLIASKNFNFQK